MQSDIKYATLYGTNEWENILMSTRCSLRPWNHELFGLSTYFHIYFLLACRRRKLCFDSWGRWYMVYYVIYITHDKWLYKVTSTVDILITFMYYSCVLIFVPPPFIVLGVEKKSIFHFGEILLRFDFLIHKWMRPEVTMCPPYLWLDCEVEG